MGLGSLLCCLKRTQKTSSQDLAVSSATTHHRSQAHASQISSVGVVPALTINSQGQEEDLPRQATHQPINCPPSIRRFSFFELSDATNNFNGDRVRGTGGFGKVFEAQLSDGTTIAVKRPRNDTESSQSREEVVKEIELCSSLSHPNVLSLLGFCDQGNEIILVYDYMSQGTLADRLYGSRSEPCLQWEQRLEMLIGAASGLHYLHTCTERGIIHRDVKGPNILLNDDLVTKIADFGVARVGPEPDRTHVTTDGKGTRGYLDLEYYNTNHLTPKSDVYAFGVVCLEALCAAKVIDDQSPWREVGLVSWAEEKLKKEGHLRGIADQRISSTIGQNSLRIFTKIVMRCLADKRKDRPSMEQVIEQLKIALPHPLSDDGYDPSDESFGRQTRPRNVIAFRTVRVRRRDRSQQA